MHSMHLSSSYATAKGSTNTRDSNGEPSATSYHSKFLEIVDYLWYSEGILPIKVLDTLPIDTLEGLVAFHGSLLCVGNLVTSWGPHNFSEITLQRTKLVEEREERSHDSLMIERLTGSEEGQIDHVLQDNTFEHPYLQAIGSHTNYWRDNDNALFILLTTLTNTLETKNLVLKEMELSSNMKIH